MRTSGHRRRLLRDHGDRLPGRALPRRLDRDPVDGDGGDHGGRDRDPRRGHAAARADLAVRPPRIRAQPDHDRPRARREAVAQPPPPLAARRIPNAAAARFWERWTADRDAPAVGVGRRERRDHADARDPGAVARMGRRRPAPVPRGQRDARGRRAGRRGGRAGRVGADADRGRRERPRGDRPLRGQAAPRPRGREGRAAGALEATASAC